MRTPVHTILAGLLASAALLPLPANGQSPATAKAGTACSLLSRAEVETVTGRRQFMGPEPTSLLGGEGSACTFGSAQLILFSGEKAEENWAAYLKIFRTNEDARYAIAGLGERAYGFYPKPRDKYEDTNAVVVVKLGRRLIAVSAVAEEGKPAESAQPHALALAKIVLAKLN